MHDNSKRIQHFLIDAPTSIKTYLIENIRIEENKINSLLDFGCIYLNHTRTFSDQSLKAGDYLRIHLVPRRFPASNFKIEEFIITENSDYWIINKPPGIPVHPTLDNYRENIVYMLENKFNCRAYITQRLDIGTQGLILLAKTPTFQTLYNRWLYERLIQKFYVALVLNPPTLGSVVHYMKNSPRSPHEVSKTPFEQGMKCELEVCSVERYETNRFQTQIESQIYSVKIKLITGRTHQIRAQLADLGSPIIGDTMYGGKEIDMKFVGEWFGLQCSSLSFPNLNDSEKLIHYVVTSPFIIPST